MVKFPSVLVCCLKINLATLLFGGYETASCGVVYTAQISPLAALLRLSRALKSPITSATHQGCQMFFFVPKITILLYFGMENVCTVYGNLE
jgi:hypothetical protein